MRFIRKSSWIEPEFDSCSAHRLAEQVVYVGAVEIISDNTGGNLQKITKTRLSPNVMHVKIQGSTMEEFFEYAHRDHLGSIEVVTDDSGNVLDNLAFEPFGSRKTKDWTANISSSELGAVLDLDEGHTRKVRGFTGHEHLDRTGLIHMNGRVYDPVLGRFLSPDPIVLDPAQSQSWNRYSYVSNTPTSLTDPSGFIEECQTCEPGWFHPTYLDYVYLFGLDRPPYQDIHTCDVDPTGCEPVDPFAKEISQIDDQFGEEGSGAALGVGTLAERTGALRDEYIKRASALDPNDTAGREALRKEFQKRLNALGRAYTANVLKNRANQSPRLSDATKTNSAVNQTAKILRYGGRALQIGAVGVEAYSIANAPEGQRSQVAIQAGGRLSGGLGGAYLGAQLGAFGGPWGVATGAIVGGIAGSIGGEELVNEIFDF